MLTSSIGVSASQITCTYLIATFIVKAKITVLAINDIKTAYYLKTTLQAPEINKKKWKKHRTLKIFTRIVF